MKNISVQTTKTFWLPNHLQHKTAAKIR